MRTPELSQDALDSINQGLRHALTDPTEADRAEFQPIYTIGREILPDARVAECTKDSSAVSYAYAPGLPQGAALGTLVRRREVGVYDVRLVRATAAPQGPDAETEVYRVVVTRARARGRGTVVLTYGSGTTRASDLATRYFEEATEVDLASDFHHDAHFFGERRIARPAPKGPGDRHG